MRTGPRRATCDPTDDPIKQTEVLEVVPATPWPRPKARPPPRPRGLELPGTVLAARTEARPKLKTWLFGRAFLRQDS